MRDERIKKLEQWVLEYPSDPFNKYALALEWKDNDQIKTDLLFCELLDLHPEYLPTYYSAAVFYSAINTNKSIEILQRGMDLALKNQDSKVFQELKLLFEEIRF